MPKPTQLDRIEVAAMSAPIAEDNKLGLMYSLFCSKCKEEKTSIVRNKHAIYVYKGNSLCLKHMEEEMNAKNV